MFWFRFQDIPEGKKAGDPREKSAELLLAYIGIRVLERVPFVL